MALRLEELAKTIDHTLLGATATLQDVEALCDEARTHHFAAVCVLPFAVPAAVEALRGCDVKVATVISYPLGADATRAKIVAAESSIAAGADELGVVLNVPALLSGDFRLVRDEHGDLSQHRPHPRRRRAAPVEARRRKRVQATPEHLADQVLLGIEVGVRGGGSDPGTRRDVAHRQPRKAHRPHLFDRGVDQAVDRVALARRERVALRRRYPHRAGHVSRW